MVISKVNYLSFILAFGFALILLAAGCNQNSGNDHQESVKEKNQVNKEEQETIPLVSREDLPEPELSLKTSLEKRRSIRDYEDGEDGVVSLDEVSQLMWAAQGITEEETGYRTAPSAGATYPMEVYLVVEEAEDLDTGVYNYNSQNHELLKLKSEAIGEDLMNAALNQEPIGDAPVNVVITSVYERVKATYGERGIRYAKMEAGHISQNLYLMSSALDLGTVAIGAFEDEEVKEILDLSEGEEPLYIMPVGRK